MIRIGIGDGSGFVYESTENYPWGPLWPAPVVMQASFIEIQDAATGMPDTQHPELLFREDTFDPVSRIRRGRFYALSETEQPSRRKTLPHPVYQTWGRSSASIDNPGGHRLYTYDALTTLLCHPPYTTHHVLLGAADSRWRIVAAEQVSTGETLVTLKSRGALGVLPELNLQAIPDMARTKARDVYGRLVDSVHREGPVSVIDRARDAAQWLLGCWLAQRDDKWGVLEQDIGGLIPKVGEQNKLIISAAQIVARLHARKPNEQHKRVLRPLTEEDADCAIACIGLLIQEFGWAA